MRLLSNKPAQPPSREMKLEYLLERELPDFLFEDLETVQNSINRGFSVEDAIKLIIQEEEKFGISSSSRPTIEQYKVALARLSEFSNMSPCDLDKIYLEEQERGRQEQRARAAAEDPHRFFNRPDAQARFDHWGRKAYWTSDEATALCLGKDPRKVNWKSVQPFLGASPFAAQYRDMRDLIERAAEVGEVGDPEHVFPARLAAWTRDHGIPIRFAMELPVASNVHSQPQSELQALVAGNQIGDATVGRMLQENDELKRSITQLKRELRAEKGARSNEKQHLLLILISIVVAAYKYNPFKSKKNIAGEISDDALQELGVEIDEGTVRSRLADAVKALPLTAVDRLKDEG